jgi:hypothetical protein
MHSKTNRRDVMKRTLLTTGAGLPLFNIARAGESSLNRLNVAYIGIGGIEQK